MIPLTKENSRKQASVQIRSQNKSQGKVSSQQSNTGQSRGFKPSQSQQYFKKIKIIYRDVKTLRENCIFCQKLQNLQAQNFGPLLTKALYAKYSSSQNYYYSKDINDLLDQESTPATVNFKDLEIILEEEEYLKRLYAKKELKGKKNALLEYYKYHKDIPRLFMQNVYSSINRFHDKRRRLEYARIKRQLGLPDDDEHTKHLTRDKKDKKSSNDISVIQLGHLLKGVNLDVSVKPKSKSLKQKDESQSHSLSYHLHDLLTTINNQKVIPVVRPQSGYQMGMDLSIFEQSVLIFNKPFEDISLISSEVNKQLKGVSYEEFKNNFKKKGKPQIQTQPQVQSSQAIISMRKVSLSPQSNKAIMASLGISGLPQQKPKPPALTNTKTTIMINQLGSGSHTDRVRLTDTGFNSNTDRQRVVDSQKQKEIRTMQSQKLVEQNLKNESQQRTLLISNSIEHFTNSDQPQQTATLIRANSNYIKRDNKVRQFVGKDIHSPNRTILKSNVSDLQTIKSHNTSQNNLHNHKLDGNFDPKNYKIAHNNVAYQGQTTQNSRNLANSIIQFTPLSTMQQQYAGGRTRSQDNIQTVTPFYVKGTSTNTNRPPSTHKPSKSEILSFGDLKKLKPAPQTLQVPQAQNYANNIYLPGNKKSPQYTINQNNIVNIYLNDPKSQLKLQKSIGASLTSRGISPKITRKIFDCDIPLQKK